MAVWEFVNTFKLLDSFSLEGLHRVMLPLTKQELLSVPQTLGPMLDFL